MIRLAIRGYKGPVVEFEERVDIEEGTLHLVIPKLATKHALWMAGKPHMIEIEFLDDPNPDARFFRIGTDPSGMVLPCLTRWRP
jgi:hypothetical protein